MSKLKIGLTLLFSVLGVLGVNEYYKPRNVRDLLKWQGIQLSSDSKVGKSMFFEYEEELKEKNINNDNELGNGCEERFKSSNLGDTQILEEAKKYCSDTATSIMGRIIREGEDNKVIKDVDSRAFLINYLVASNKEELLKLIEFKKEQNEEEPKLEQVASKLKEGCKAEKRRAIMNSKDLGKFGEFKKRCYDLKVRNFLELLKKQGRKPISEIEKYKDRLKENMRRSTGLAKELNEILKKGNKKEQIKILARQKRLDISVDTLDTLKGLLKKDDFLDIAALLYKSYCDSKGTKDLISDEKDLSDYAMVSSRCTEEAI